jgi:hypothetical protein
VPFLALDQPNGIATTDAAGLIERYPACGRDSAAAVPSSRAKDRLGTNRLSRMLAATVHPGRTRRSAGPLRQAWELDDADG